MRPSHPPSLISEPLPGPSLFKSILGHIVSARRHMLPGIQWLEGQYGPFFCLRFGIRDVVFVSDPEIVEEFLTGSGDLPKGPSVCPVKLAMGNKGLLLSDGAHWRRNRRAMAPYMTPRSVERYSEEMGAVVRGRLSHWCDGQDIDVTSEMTEITLRVLSRCLFGDSLPDDGPRKVQSILTRLLEDVNLMLATWRLFVPKWWPLGARRRIVSLRLEIERLVDLMIARKMEKGTDEDDVLGQLLTRMTGDDEQFEKDDLVDEVIGLLLAGHETTSTTLTMIWVLLTQHPEVQSRVVAEIDETLAGRQVISEDVGRLPLAAAVIDEALRLYAPVWSFDRTVSEDRVVRGKLIRAGSSIVIVPALTHSNSHFFSRPEEFCPDRWLTDAQKDLPKCAFMPFGRGSRACIGQHFARREILITVVTILQEWTIGCSELDDLNIETGFVLRPASNVTGVVAARRR